MIDEVAVLIYITHGKDEDGFPVDIEERAEVFVREKSASRAEFYESLRSGITASEMFEVRLEDWMMTKHITENGKAAYATRIEYDGAVYDIIRAYKNDRSMIELTCA